MRFSMLQLLKNLRFHSNGKEITDAHILDWANSKVKSSGSQSRMNSFKVLFRNQILALTQILCVIRCACSAQTKIDHSFLKFYPTIIEDNGTISTIIFHLGENPLINILMWDSYTLNSSINKCYVMSYVGQMSLLPCLLLSHRNHYGSTLTYLSYYQLRNSG